MKVLFFTRLFYPHVGGVEKHVFELSRVLIKKGHKITVVTEHHSSSLKLKENIEGMEVFRIPDLKEGEFKKFRIWKWLWENKKLIKNSDIIHCHDVFFWYLPFRFIFPTKKIFTTFHGYESYPLSPKSVFIRKISEKFSNGNICIGHFIKKWYGTKPDYVTYGAVEISNFKSQISNKINKESAVFIGRLDEQTGILTYVNAVKLIRKKIPGFKFEIIGDGKFRQKIEKDFPVLGFQENPGKYFLKYNFAFVSRYLSILEAMAVRKLVFAVYDNPIKEDYLRMAPFSKFIVICNSSSDLVSKIYFYLDSPKEKEEMIENAYNWVKKHTWEEMINVYLRVWRV